MATSTLPIILVFLLAATASARPCKTLFYFSATTTTTYYPYNPLNRNPNPNSIFHRHSPRYLTLIFTTTTTTRFPNHRGAVNFDPNNPLDEDSRSLTSSDFPVKFYSSVSSSIRHRTRDIISVLGALLFGVCCGVLTGLAVYLLWALISPRRFDFDDVSSSSSDDDDDDDITVAKKLGYVAIPANPKLVEDDLKKPTLTAKEVV